MLPTANKTRCNAHLDIHGIYLVRWEQLRIYLPNILLHLSNQLITQSNFLHIYKYYVSVKKAFIT